MIRRTDSQGDTIHFFKIKDLQYFKELLQGYDLSIVREFLQNNIDVVMLLPFVSYQTQFGYRYIPSQNGKVAKEENGEVLHLRQGYAVGEINEKLMSDDTLLFYRISLKTELILKKLYYLDMPIMNGIKCSQKLLFYGKSQIRTIDYGSYVYRKGQSVDAIYYVLEGEVRVLKKRNEGFAEVTTVQKGKMFGIYCFKYGKTVRELMARSIQNGTKVLVIFKSILDSICKSKDVTIEQLLENVRSQFYSMLKRKTIKRRQEDIENEKRQRELTFEKRIRGFQEEHKIKNKFLEDLAQAKTLFVKVRDLNSSARKKSEGKKTIILANSTELSLRNYQKRHKNHTTELMQAASTYRQTFTRGNGMIRSLVGLARYPSVQKYINRLSCQEQE